MNRLVPVDIGGNRFMARVLPPKSMPVCASTWCGSTLTWRLASPFRGSSLISRFGAFLFMGLIGIVIASLVNIFVGSNALQFAISVIGVIVFTGLTAYDTQRIKQVYLASDPADMTTKKAILGALTLYLDFINLFVMLLQLTGQRRDQ